MLLQGNQNGTFHLYIPAFQFVVVLRYVQAPAEITKILIIMTSWFSAKLHHFLEHLVQMIYKTTISGVPRL